MSNSRDMPPGAAKLSLRAFLLIGAISGWIGSCALAAGLPQTLVALSFNIYFLLVICVLSTFTRTISLRIVALMVMAGGAAFGLAVLVEKLFFLPTSSLPASNQLKEIIIPLIEQTLRMTPLIVALLLMRRFTFWTLSITDVLLMGAASGTGFAFIYDAIIHSDKDWRHLLSWLPTADSTGTGHLIAGHAVWATISAGVLAISLMLGPKRKLSWGIIAGGLIWVVLDQSAAMHAALKASSLKEPLAIMTANGFASAWLMIVVITVALLWDLYIQFKYTPDVEEFRLKLKDKESEKANSIWQIWEFILDRRKLAAANYRRMSYGFHAAANMPVALLAQCLINHQSPSRVAGFLEKANNFKNQVLTEDLPQSMKEGVFLTSDTFKLPPHYQLISKLSAGGMGSVYKARHLRTDGIIAIKLLHQNAMEDEKVRERFKLEAKTASRLQHPNLVAIHDYGVTESNVPFIVMEHIEGITLQNEIARLNGLPPARFFKIFEQVCDGLLHAHSKGVIHRDIKPSNIILARSGNDFAKIVDFGIAKVMDENLVDCELTKTGDIVGSPLYMSPEQCLGEPLDHRTDIYSLGCVMYEAICAKPPLAGENPVKTIFKQVNVVPEKISRIRPDLNIPTSVELILFKALEKKPSDRFVDIAELKAALEMARGVMHTVD